MSLQIHTALLLVALALAAAVGGMLRFAIANVIARRWGVQFPLGTLLVNSSAALMMGLLAAWLAVFPAYTGWGQVIAGGLLGSYSTVSSFSLQTLILWQSHHYRQVLLNIGLSFGLCLSLVLVGFKLGNLIW
ncbi:MULTISPECIES: fluoride efflux transporter FluC [unclassified Arsukibacterium]|uniref:fluoride efflux transporter FluC n=1 Tax=unclassified Arsukibacterium TaxID=2635278 RepID=UPI0025B88EEE|nr:MULTISPECIES: CrcB family protein [unclassified Arsukibacterium]